MELSGQSDNITLADTGLPGGAALDKIASGVKNLLKKKKPETNYDPPAGYQIVCKEGDTLDFATPTDVAYGCNGNFKYLTGVTGKILFSNERFGGDPDRNDIKAGYVKIGAAINSTGSSAGNSLFTTTNLKKAIPFIIGIVLIVVIYMVMKKGK